MLQVLIDFLQQRKIMNIRGLNDLTVSLSIIWRKRYSKRMPEVKYEEFLRSKPQEIYTGTPRNFRTTIPVKASTERLKNSLTTNIFEHIRINLLAFAEDVIYDQKKKCGEEFVFHYRIGKTLEKVGWSTVAALTDKRRRQRFIYIPLCVIDIFPDANQEETPTYRSNSRYALMLKQELVNHLAYGGEDIKLLNSAADIGLKQPKDKTKRGLVYIAVSFERKHIGPEELKILEEIEKVEDSDTKGEDITEPLGNLNIDAEDDAEEIEIIFADFWSSLPGKS